MRKINLGEYIEDDFSSREAMAREIERDTIRVMQAEKRGYARGYKTGRSYLYKRVKKDLEDWHKHEQTGLEDGFKANMASAQKEYDDKFQNAENRLGIK